MSTGPGKRRWEQERCVIEMIDEPCYTFGSVDNVRRYDREIILEREHHLVSKSRAALRSSAHPAGRRGSPNTPASYWLIGCSSPSATESPLLRCLS
jgi:hypothetical protein